MSKKIAKLFKGTLTSLLILVLLFGSIIPVTAENDYGSSGQYSEDSEESNGPKEPDKPEEPDEPEEPEEPEELEKPEAENSLLALHPVTTPFRDVPPDAWFGLAVAWAYENDITTGTSPTTFSPNRNVTRGEFATFLYRTYLKAGGRPNTGGTVGFSDMTDRTRFYYQPVYWAKNSGIITGYPDGTFRPYRNIIRQDIATMLFRFADYMHGDTAASAFLLSRHPDSDRVSDYAIESMQWATTRGIVQGRSGMWIAPRATATRAEALTMLRRYIVNEPFTPPQLPDPPPHPDDSHTIRHCHRNGFPSSHRGMGRSGWVPDMIAMHTSASTAQGAINWSFNSNPRVSYHFVIDRYGTITQIVPITDTAWSNGTRTDGSNVCFSRARHPVVRNRPTNANFYTVSIGFGDAGGNATWGWGQLTDEQVSAGVWLVEHIRFEIWRNYGVVIPVSRANVIGHNEINSTACPGPLFPFDAIISNVR